MIKILFICHGNICRSPMAEFVMKDLVKKAGVAEKFHIASAAVSREELGNPVYPPARRELAKHGIACDGHAAHQITQKEYDVYDYIYYMDRSNASYLRRLLKDTKKCFPLLNHDVADPWYTGDFTETWNDVVEGCTRILVTAELDTIKERFAQRMHGSLPAPVSAMLKRSHGCFDQEPCDFHVHSGVTDLDVVCKQIIGI